MSENRAVLVIVDVQNGFITEHSRHVVPVIADLVERWQSTGGDVVFTRYLNYSGSPFERIMGWSKLKDSPEIDIVDQLQPYIAGSTACVDKHIYSMFNDEGEELVHDHQWSDMYVCGIDTEVCVLKTAVDAFERGIRSWVLVDASASHSGEVAHEAGLVVAEKMVGRTQLVTSDSITAR